MSAFVIRTSFPREQPFAEHLTVCIYVNIDGGFCEKINLTVHVNRHIFTFKPKVGGKKNRPTGPVCYYVLPERKHWPCLYTLP